MFAQSLPPEQTADVVLGDTRISTRSAGQGPDVVVLHGGPGAGHQFLVPHLRPLAKARRLRYYDQRGSGHSKVGPRSDLAWSTHVHDLSRLLAHWRIQRANLLGYSWGGLLALLFALEHPDRVARIALVAPAPVTAHGRQTMIERFRARLEDPDLKRERESLEQSDLRHEDPAAYRRRAFELSVYPYFRDPAHASRLESFVVSARVRDAVWRSLGAYDLRDRLGTLTIPTLVVHGRHDPIPLETAEQTAKLLHARLEVFEDSGHLPFVEESDRFLAVLGDFLPDSLP